MLRLTDKQQKFIESYVETNNATQSAIAAGYSEKTAKQQGHDLTKSLKDPIDAAIKEKLSTLQGRAVSRLASLIDAESEAIQLSAVKDILDRTGHKPTEKQEITHEAKPSPEEVQEQIMAYIQRNGLQH